MRNLDRIYGFIILAIIFFLFSNSSPRLTTIEDRINILVANQSFDFLSWTVNAISVKMNLAAIGAPHYIATKEQYNLVMESLDLITQIEKNDHAINMLYSNPAVKDPGVASGPLREKQQLLTNRWMALAPLAEAVLEMQVTEVLKDEGLTTGGQPIPWVLYHVTPLPQNLVISKREKIGAEANFILTPLNTPDAEKLEDTIDKNENVSSLVVEIGGLADYPTMIMRTTALDWLTNTIAHEWTHIYLAQHPLGNNYTTPELRTMNETTASISGSEIGKIVLQRYYPELLSQTDNSDKLISFKNDKTPPPTFDFRTEMQITRIGADTLLAQGKIDEAETYMEQRRQIFWNHGYAIRKINQAYFAFYGSYADTPGGAAGQDPVGPAVRALRAQSISLKAFLERIAAMSSFTELQKAVGN